MGEIRFIATTIFFGMALPTLACETQAIKIAGFQVLHEEKSELGYFCAAESRRSEIILVMELSDVQARWSLMEVVRSFLDEALARVETQAAMSNWQDLRSKLITVLQDRDSMIRLYIPRKEVWSAFLLKNVNRHFLTPGPYEVLISARQPQP